MPRSPSNICSKGSKVYLEGQLQTRKWEDQQGQERYSTEVVLQGFNSALTMLDTRSGGDQPGGYSGGSGDFGQSGPMDLPRREAAKDFCASSTTKSRFRAC